MCEAGLDGLGDVGALQDGSREGQFRGPVDGGLSVGDVGMRQTAVRREWGGGVM